jgi:threonine/homoserine/homoserine lactone efflux protein
MRTKKHVLEFFRKDPWPVRVGVLAMWLIFLLVLAVLLSGPLTKSRWFLDVLKWLT